MPGWHEKSVFFNEKTLTINPSDFVEITESLCKGLENLELVEEGKEDVHFEKSKLILYLKLL